MATRLEFERRRQPEVVQVPVGVGEQHELHRILPTSLR
jgi:hypothetical protein